MDNKQQNIEEGYIMAIKEFVNSPAYKEYMLPMIMQVVQKELPKPGTERWQEKYTYHYALTEAFTMFVNTLNNLSNKDQFLKEAENYMEGIE